MPYLSTPLSQVTGGNRFTSFRLGLRGAARCLAILSQFRLQDIGSDYIRSFSSEQKGLWASDLECFSTAAWVPIHGPWAMLISHGRPAPFSQRQCLGLRLHSCLSLRLEMMAGLHVLQSARRRGPERSQTQFRKIKLQSCPLEFMAGNSLRMSGGCFEAFMDALSPLPRENLPQPGSQRATPCALREKPPLSAGEKEASAGFHMPLGGRPTRGGNRLSPRRGLSVPVQSRPPGVRSVGEQCGQFPRTEEEAAGHRSAGGHRGGADVRRRGTGERTLYCHLHS